MGKARLEAFSDGVIAILITIMVLELKVEHGSDWRALEPVLPALLTYLLSYVFLGIYWVNHHHMLQTVERVSGRVLWANLHLLFWLSLVPAVTGWLGENHDAVQPTALYGGVLIGCAIAYTILQSAIIATHGPGSKLAVAVGADLKGRLSLLLYAAAIALAFVHPAASDALYVTVAGIWLIPDRRIERIVAGGALRR
jgi:TMEM175 potassium channel family protein